MPPTASVAPPRDRRSRIVGHLRGLFWPNPLTAIGWLIIFVGGIAAVIGPSVAPHDPQRQTLRARLQPPTVEHPMGTDHLGRDVYSRVLHGARISIPIGVAAITIALALGLSIGLISGFVGGWVDDVTMRVVDVFLCFPLLLLAIIFSTVFGSGLVALTVAIGLAYFPRFARLARSSTLQVRTLDFVLASRALGSHGAAIMARHILPNIAGPVVVLATLGLGGAIIVESSLSFIGLGADPLAPTWGKIASDGLRFLRDAPWISGFACLAIVLVVIGFNIVGDALRDLLDPRA